MNAVKKWYRELRDELRDNDGAPPFDWQTNVVFITSTALLIVFYYYGRAAYFRRSELDDWAVTQLGAWGEANAGMLPYAYWGTASLIIRVVIPALIIVFVLRHKLGDYGFRLKGIGKHMPIYGLAFLGMLPLLYWASLQGDFQQKYPFYGGALTGGRAFWEYQAFYALQFIGVEIFFRGYMLFGLKKRLGYYAIPVMVIPYTMIHFNKPIAETFGAIFAGLFLGYLAIRSKSFVPGILLHWGVAITMDVLAVVQHNGGTWSAFSVFF